ncbi:MAG TPA: DUF6456 domain-containing protein [Alphaproteobacteria bacterium]|nr:DUF6456 domain-containing protein [Alphaproteobacteria bacterium]
MPKKPRRPPVSRDKRFKKQSHGPDFGPAERWQHSARIMEFTENAGVFAARAQHQHVLDRLVALRFIDAPQREAGLKLHSAGHTARIMESVSASLSAVRMGAGDPERRLQRNAAQEAAYASFRRALAAVPAEARDVVIHVACLDCWPGVEQLARLKDGLASLAKHYGIF